ncbi:hypothetical protein [Rhizobium leguminosarum]|uniref:hypothetical protein n=1 Tax=Rhizobium leguminosarum TaxID=384 RepID=UPI001C95AB7C|nr:hypothetical protein [Rhizobium leguminosarum]MBY5657193.1 hypothetical protein [Rhizobium leguminosarum]
MPLSAAVIWSNGPAGSPTQPDKQEIREWGTWVESTIQAFTSSGGLLYETRADLYADLAHDANAFAWVLGDPVAANNGVYQKIDDSGAGYWRRAGDLPFSFIIATDSGAGTPDAIKATSPIPISASALVVLKVSQANISSPVTVSFNDGTPVTIKTNSGNDIAPAGVVPDMVLFGFLDGANYRLISDQVSSAIVAEAEGFAADAEAFRDQAADYAALALNDKVLNTFAGNGTTTVFTLSVPPGSRANTDINVDGVYQLKSSYTVSGTTLTFSEAPPGDGVNFNIEVSMGGKIDVGTPGSETVNADKIDGSDITAIRTKLSVYSKAQVDSLVAVTGGLAGKLYGLAGSQNTFDALNDMDFAAGEAASSGANPVIMALAATLTKRSDAVWAVGNNNGAMDTGTKPTSTWLYWYLIMRPDTGVVDVCCSASATAPSIGTNIPAAYTKYRYIRATLLDSGGNIVPDSQNDDEILWVTNRQDFNSTLGTTASLITLSVPAGRKMTAIIEPHHNTVSSGQLFRLSSPDQADVAVDNETAFNAGGIAGGATLMNVTAGQQRYRTNTSRQIRGRASVASAHLTISTIGYIDPRGRI